MSRPPDTLRPILIILLFLLILLFPSCGGSNAPAQGSPEWLYLAARDSFRGGDIDKAQEHLGKLAGLAGNPYQARAVAWNVLIKSGRLLGYEELVDSYNEGALHAAAGTKINFVRDRA